MSLAAASWLACAVLVAAPVQQQAPSPPGAGLVVIDANVVDRDGRPVGDLRPADFTLLIDSKPRPLVSAEFVSLAPTGAAQPAGRPAPTISDGFSANDQARPGRLFLLAIDQLHLRAGSVNGAVQAAGRFLDQLSPGDQVGLIAFPEPGPSVAFTTDHAQVKEALAKITGRTEGAQGKFRLSLAEALASPQAAQGGGSRDTLWQMVVDRECPVTDRVGISSTENCISSLDSEAKAIIDTERRSTEATSQVLVGVVERLGDIEAPKTLVLVTEGLPGGPGLDASASANPIASVARAAMSARVTVYALQLDRGFIGSSDATKSGTSGSVAIESNLQAGGLEAIAGPSRGAVFKVTSTADRSFARVVMEASGYYLLRFESEPGERDGLPHRLALRVNRGGATVRSRAEFVAGAARITPKTPEDDVRAMLGSPLVVSSLPLRLGAFVMRDAGSPAAVRTLVAADIDAGVRTPEEVTLGLSVTDGAGKSIGGYVRKETLKPFGTGESACLKFSDAFLVNPGEYVIRLAVVDSRGRRGSAVHRVIATIPRAGNVETSDLLLIDPTGGAAEGGTPVVTSTIASEAVGMYMEIYYPRGQKPRDVKVTADVASEAEGPAIFATQASIADRPEQQRVVATAVLNTPLLPQGTYLARALVELDGRPVGRALRTFYVLSAGSPGGNTAGRSVPRNLVAFGEAGSLVRPFKRSTVLSPEVVGYFLNRMTESGGQPAAPPVLSAIEHAKTNQLDKVLADLSGGSTDDLAVTFLRGLARLSMGETDPAAREFRAALGFAPEFLPAVFYLGACHAAAGQDRDAVGAWQTALITESDTRIVYDVLADAYIRLRDAAQAEAIMREAMAKWPDDDLFVPRLAASLALAGRDTEALSILGGYVARRSDDDQALFLAVRLLYEALAKGRTLRSPAQDREDFARFAKLYQATKGANKEIVARWVKFIETRAR